MGEGSVFTGVCSKGGSALEWIFDPAWRGIPPPPPPRNRPPRYGQLSVGTYPTGMYSCFDVVVHTKVRFFSGKEVEKEQKRFP